MRVPSRHRRRRRPSQSSSESSASDLSDLKESDSSDGSDSGEDEGEEKKEEEDDDEDEQESLWLQIIPKRTLGTTRIPILRGFPDLLAIKPAASFLSLFMFCLKCFLLFSHILA